MIQERKICSDPVINPMPDKYNRSRKKISYLKALVFAQEASTFRMPDFSAVTGM